MTEIPYGRLHALETVLGGRAAVESAVEQGQVLTGGGLPSANKSRQAPMWTGSEWVADGVPRIERCPFAYDTPGLRTGVPIFTPEEGDLLLDVWIEVVTAWNGTNPFADIGSFTFAAGGWFSSMGSGIDLSHADSENELDGLMRDQSTAGNGISSDLSLATVAAIAINNHWGTAVRTLPATFVAADPIKLVVSQDASATGADPGATQGSGFVYLMVATPAQG